MPKQQLKMPDPKDIVDPCLLDEAASMLGFEDYAEYSDSRPNKEERTAFWEEYAWLRGEELEMERITRKIKTIKISEGLWQSNNLKLLI